jgi:hypothetical protein
VKPASTLPVSHAFLPNISLCYLSLCLPVPASLTKESITQSDGHRLGLCVVRQRCLTKLTTDTRLLVATEWDLVVQHVVAVDPDGTSLQRVRDADCGVEVGGVDGRGETVVGVVASLDDLLLSGELGNGADRSEDLLSAE